MRKNHFIFDKNKCVGCEACVVACINENGFQEPERWRHVHQSNNRKYPNLLVFHLSMSCNHCEDALCMNHCPALAYSRHPLTEAVSHQAEACIGCKYCTWNCPYDAPKYIPQSGIVDKCNFCQARLETHQKPACASLCPTTALDFSFEETADSAEHDFIPIDTKPALEVRALEKSDGPKMDMSLFEGIEQAKPIEKKQAKLSAIKEWPLLCFSFIVAVMIAVSVTDAMLFLSVTYKLLFLALGAIAALLSLFHLGKPLRAWRSVLNLKQSWLSREIFSFGLFYGLSVVDLLVVDLPHWIILIPAVMLMASIDMLYVPVQRLWKYQWHSGQISLISISMVLLLFQSYYLLVALLLFRLVLMLLHHKQKPKSIWVALRLGLLIISGMFIALEGPMLMVFLSFGIAEFLDRILFYNDLELVEVDL